MGGVIYSSTGEDKVDDKKTIITIFQVRVSSHFFCYLSWPVQLYSELFPIGRWAQSFGQAIDAN